MAADGDDMCEDGDGNSDSDDESGDDVRHFTVDY